MESKKFKIISLVLAMLTTGLLISTIVLAALYSDASTSTSTGSSSTTPSSATTTSQSERLCTSPACIKAANMILENMDETVNPCEDFNLFSCGGFIKNKRIPSDATSIDPLVDLSVNLDNDVADELGESNDKDIESIKNAKNLYRSCLNEELIESNGEERMVEVIKRKIGGWQLLDSSYSVDQDQLFDKLARMDMELGTRPFFEVLISPNPKHPNQNILRIQQPGIFYDKNYYENEQFMIAYKEYAMSMVRALNEYQKTTFDELDVENMIILEKEISMHLLDPTERRSLKYLNTTVGELNNKFPGINWEDYIVKKIFGARPEHKVDGKEIILVDDASYFGNITELFALIASQPEQLKDLDNLAVWFFVRSKANYLPKAYRDIRSKFDQILQGSSNPPPRSRICASIVVQRMPFAVGRLYVNKRFPEASKQAAKEMIQNIRDEFKIILNQVDWMDAVSKKAAEEKVDTIDVQIGYPDYTNNDTYLNDLYKEFKFTEKEFLENFILASTGEVNKALDEFRTVRTFKDWLITPAIVNAYYSPDQNQICFPAGILQAPLYDAKVPNYLNYGGIGSIIGHEITHGFDDQGRKYDKNGVMFDDDQAGGLWSQATIAQYTDKAKCISNQYSKYLVKQINMTLNGDLTLGENIADNGGIKEAYKAYKRWLKEKNNGQAEELLPGVKYNQDQLFFINYAQAWCTKWTDASLRAQVLGNYHSPGEFRIIGPTSNSQDFADVFKCQGNTPNNPANKCTVW